VSDGFDGVPQHCDKPMRWTGTHHWWEGKPGDPDGASITVTRFACAKCPATLAAELRVPDGDA
jgi:hypothetical protein